MGSLKADVMKNSKQLKYDRSVLEGGNRSSNRWVEEALVER